MKNKEKKRNNAKIEMTSNDIYLNSFYSFHSVLQTICSYVIE